MRQALRSGRRLFVRSCGLGLLSAAALLAGARGTQDAVANGDTRTISIHHMHTREVTTVTFRRDGRYVAEALEQLNHALRDWRNDDKIRMDPRLFDIAWEVHRETGSSGPFHVVSAYRSPGTNAMLRRRSRGVAKHSQHMEGKAMDFYLPDVSSATIRAVGMKLQRGGVGYYPTANTPFVHLDVGSVRSWPRMTRDQLARLFPNGDTVHIAADGRPLEGYEIAKAQILARGGSVGGYSSGDFDEGAIMQGSRRSLWASLFGWNEEEEVAPARGRAARGRSAPQQQTLAYAPSSSGDGADMYGVFRRAPVETPAAQSLPLRPRAAEPQIAAAPAPVAAPTPAPAAPAAPPPPRLVAAPFPTARPTDLPGPVQLASIAPGGTGQRLNWQQGPAPANAQGAAQPVAAAQPGVIAEGGRIVLAPLPPRRPGDAQAFAVAAAPAATADAPGRLVAVSHPAPPERPRLALAPLASASLRPAAPAASPPPSSAPMPAALMSSPPASTPPPSDRQALDNLFAAVATGALPNSATRVTTTKARTAQPQPGALGAEPAPAASLGFSQRDPNDTRADRFSGPAVRPLPTTYTSR
jgi:uncharacterized protein YcbK (DUF882 family)